MSDLMRSDDRLHGVVIGGGLVGASAALALANQGYSVTLIERQAPQISRGSLGVDIRNVALNLASIEFLTSLGVWDERMATPYQRMRVWEQWGTGALDLSAAEVGQERMGALLEMSVVLDALWQALERSPVALALGNLTALSVTDDGVDLQCGDTTLRADFLVAADGGQSAVRKILGEDVEQFAVDQVALATVLETERPHAGVAYQRFLQEGPLALLPAPTIEGKHRVSVVWSQTRASAERLAALADEDFDQEITARSEACLGQVLAHDQRIIFPLTQQAMTQAAINERVVFIGDAVRIVHPLAGLGVNLGFEDLQALLELTRGGLGLGTERQRRRYNRSCYARARQMIALLGAINRFYRRTDPATSWIRNIGVGLFQGIGPLRQQVMREAMGL